MFSNLLNWRGFNRPIKGEKLWNSFLCGWLAGELFQNKEQKKDSIAVLGKIGWPEG
jgi:hypothetical protein